MKIWEDRAKELLQPNKNNVFNTEWHILDTLQLEMKQAGIFAEDHLDKQRIDMAQQIINIVKNKK